MSNNSANPEGEKERRRHPLADRDLNEVHGSIVREQNEPVAADQPVSVWLITLFCLILFAGGLYLGTHSGGFKSDVFDQTMINYGPAQAAGARGPDPVARGRTLYSANCSQCHQTSGVGIPGQYPPLAGSEIAQSLQGWGPNHVVMIVMNGLSGPINVRGATFNGTMPTHKEMLKDEQIAFILTYVRQEWGNKASPITKEGVATIRAEYGSRPQPWTEEELKAIPAKDLPNAEPPKENPTNQGKIGEKAPAPAENSLKQPQPGDKNLAPAGQNPNYSPNTNQPKSENNR